MEAHLNLYDFRKALARVGFTSIASAGRLFGYNERTARRWADGEVAVPRIIEIVLGLMQKYNVRPEGIPPPHNSDDEWYRRMADGPIAFTRPERPAKPDPE